MKFKVIVAKLTDEQHAFAKECAAKLGCSLAKLATEAVLSVCGTALGKEPPATPATTRTSALSELAKAQGFESPAHMRKQLLENEMARVEGREPKKVTAPVKRAPRGKAAAPATPAA